MVTETSATVDQEPVVHAWRGLRRRSVILVWLMVTLTLGLFTVRWFRLLAEDINREASETLIPQWKGDLLLVLNLGCILGLITVGVQYYLIRFAGRRSSSER